MDDYTKLLEQQNEELKQKLADMQLNSMDAYKILEQICLHSGTTIEESDFGNMDDKEFFRKLNIGAVYYDIRNIPHALKPHADKLEIKYKQSIQRKEHMEAMKDIMSKSSAPSNAAKIASDYYKMAMNEPFVPTMKI